MKTVKINDLFFLCNILDKHDKLNSDFKLELVKIINKKNQDNINFFYKYLKDNIIYLAQIKDFLVKLKKMGIKEIQFDETFTFSQEKYNIDTKCVALENSYLDELSIPIYPPNTINYKTTSCMINRSERIKYIGDLLYMSISGKEVLVNSLMFDSKKIQLYLEKLKQKQVELPQFYYSDEAIQLSKNISYLLDTLDKIDKIVNIKDDFLLGRIEKKERNPWSTPIELLPAPDQYEYFERASKLSDILFEIRKDIGRIQEIICNDYKLHKNIKFDNLTYMDGQTKKVFHQNCHENMKIISVDDLIILCHNLENNMDKVNDKTIDFFNNYIMENITNLKQIESLLKLFKELGIDTLKFDESFDFSQSNIDTENVILKMSDLEQIQKLIWPPNEINYKSTNCLQRFNKHNETINEFMYMNISGKKALVNSLLFNPQRLLLDLKKSEKPIKVTSPYGIKEVIEVGKNSLYLNELLKEIESIISNIDKYEFDTTKLISILSNLRRNILDLNGILWGEYRQQKWLIEEDEYALRYTCNEKLNEYKKLIQEVEEKKLYKGYK